MFLRPAVRTAILFAFLLILGGSVICAGAYISSGFDMTCFSTVKPETFLIAEDEPFRDIEVELELGSLNLQKALDGKAKVVCRATLHHSVSVTVEDGVLKIREIDQERTGHHWYNILYIDLSRENYGVTIFLPEEKYRSITASTRSGRLMLSKHFAFDTVTLRSESGTLRLNATVHGTAQMLSDSGRLLLSGVEPENLIARTGSGSVRFYRAIVRDTLDIQTGSGGITLTECDAGNTVLTTDSGGIYATFLTDKSYDIGTESGYIQAPAGTTGAPRRAQTKSGGIYMSTFDRRRLGRW